MAKGPVRVVYAFAGTLRTIVFNRVVGLESRISTWSASVGVIRIVWPTV
jgi:hypothetical protein